MLSTSTTTTPLHPPLPPLLSTLLFRQSLSTLSNATPSPALPSPLSSLGLSLLGIQHHDITLMPPNCWVIRLSI